MELSTDVTPLCKLIILSVTNVGSNGVDVVSVTCVGSVITSFKLFNKIISLKLCRFGLRGSSFKSLRIITCFDKFNAVSKLSFSISQNTEGAEGDLYTVPIKCLILLLDTSTHTDSN